MEGNTEFQQSPQQKLNPEIRNLDETEELAKLVKGRFNRVSKKEEEAGGPKIVIDIFYSAHGTAKDMEGLAKQFEEADIYIPEMPGWNADELGLFRKISEGEKNPEEVLPSKTKEKEDTFLKGQLNLIYNSKKPIIFVDLPEGHTLLREHDNLWDKFEIKFGQSFKSAINFQRNFLEKFAAIEEERERYMLDKIGSLKQLIPKLFKDHPNLKEKQEIKILLSLGASHTSIYHYLKKNSPLTRAFSNMPFTFSFGDEAIRRFTMNKQVDHRLAGNALLEVSIYTAYGDKLSALTPYSDKFEEVVRKLILGFNFDEIKNIFEGAHDLEEWKLLFEQELSKKGLKIPESEKELDEFLAKPISSSPKSPEQKS